MTPSDYVDPFLGNTTTDLPEDRGIAMAWSWPKSETGNTHPGACIPFGMVSAGAYSGAYVSGYGSNRVTTYGLPAPLFESRTATGFTHFQVSGTGTIGSYYNYLRVWPASAGEPRRWELREEVANPGYYACTLGEEGIRAEVTVTRHGAIHRYRAEAPHVLPSISIDCSSIGLDPEIHRELDDRDRQFSAAGYYEIADDNLLIGRVVMHGITVHFAVTVDACTTARLWRGDGSYLADRSFEFKNVTRREAMRSGIEFSLPEDTLQSSVRIGFSFRSAERALANLSEVQGRGFDEVASEARSRWDEALGRITVEGERARLTVFYSALYHSLIKPIDCEDENPYYDIDGPCTVDLATLWDQSKSLLPLLNAVYPEQGAKVVDTLAMIGERVGFLPNGLILSDDLARFDEATGLAYIVIGDAHSRGVSAADWSRVARIMEKTFRDNYRDFLTSGYIKPAPKTINLSRAAAATVRIARRADVDGDRQDLVQAARAWRNAFEESSGLLEQSSVYYEGSRWNYSFPLLHDQRGRLRLFKNAQAALETIDRFFGYYDTTAGATDEREPPNYEEPRTRPERSIVLERFEGLNNEPDMESPWVYHYLGRPDRTSEVVKSVLRYRFGTGPGGLPGNDDSGGTSSWYIWASIGLFPVTGTGLYLITLPEFPKIAVTVPGGRRLLVQVEGYTDIQIYVESVRLNGEELHRTWITHEEFSAGGELRIVGSSSPTDWGTGTQPPSFEI